LLFSYFEYTGTDLAADMKKMAADHKTQEWWAITNPMQTPLENRRRESVWRRSSITSEGCGRTIV
jgi:L-rhamnose mutarotase